MVHRLTIPADDGPNIVADVDIDTLPPRVAALATALTTLETPTTLMLGCAWTARELAAAAARVNIESGLELSACLAVTANLTLAPYAPDRWGRMPHDENPATWLTYVSATIPSWCVPLSGDQETPDHIYDAAVEEVRAEGLLPYHWAYSTHGDPTLTRFVDQQIFSALPPAVTVPYLAARATTEDGPQARWRDVAAYRAYCADVSDYPRGLNLTYHEAERMRRHGQRLYHDALADLDRAHMQVTPKAIAQSLALLPEKA